MFLRPALLIAGVGFAVAQTTSSDCYSTLVNIASSPSVACLDLSLLVPLSTANSSASVISTVNNWLTGMCSLGPCTNATLQQIVTSVTSGCSNELASLGLATNDTAALVSTVQAGYPTVRRIACLKDTSANELCVTELLTDIQSAGNTVNITGLVANATSGGAFNLPQNATCSNCSKAAYTLAAQNFPLLISGEQSTLQSECGSSFTDGKFPSGIRDTASNSTSSNSTSSTGAAVSLSVSGLNAGVVTLVVVSSAFAMFA